MGLLLYVKERLLTGEFLKGAFLEEVPFCIYNGIHLSIFLC
ncbi:hypothetical protein SAMN04487866_10792 [Thermoactinomyces sp. DSM 45891]|nr:hypothetical protein SAMN04487866_10792 [Thermoactinomyces sp. DSM 45891]